MLMMLNDMTDKSIISMSISLIFKDNGTGTPARNRKLTDILKAIFSRILIIEIKLSLF